VLRLEVADDYTGTFDIHVVGSSVHQELWIPADALEEFNRHIVGFIAVEEAFFGNDFKGEIPKQFGLAGKDAIAQIRALSVTLPYSSVDFAIEVSANSRAVFLNFPFWKAAGASRLGIEPDELQNCLSTLTRVWAMTARPAPLIQNATVG